MQAAVAVGSVAQLFKVVFDLLWQVSNIAGRDAIAKRLISPQRAQHLCQVRFTRAEEARDPHTWLFVLTAQIAQVGR
ncbi:hypothetical protein D3C87_2064290 [compost metagenome]